MADDDQNNPQTNPDAADDAPSAGLVVDAAAFDKLKKEKEDLYNQLLRLSADYQNSMKRAATEIDGAVDRARGDVYRQIIPVIDHFDTAIAALGDEAKTVSEGVRIVHDELLKVLKQSGVDRIEPKAGEPFDPHVHEAMMRQPAEGIAANHVTATYQPGYVYKGRTLRPAKVAVAP